ncbi:membrane protein [Colletotrichum tabaci]|uniref:Membrane protein n=1 Tax=Colletotrichum tabaci TaxID=1209068 RepID=A0AAV9TKG3_9PEZI
MDDGTPSGGRSIPQPAENVSQPVLPDDEESLTAAESDAVLEESTSSNASREQDTHAAGYTPGHTYGTAPKPIDGVPKTTTTTTPPPRALAPDLLRGLLMALMAMDHNVIGLNSWPHSTGPDPMESDSAPVLRWNRPLGYAVRALSHLCAPGFTLLLGVGVVYFARSRSRMGWSAARMARYFAARAAVLTAVSVVMGFVLTQGQFWFMNIVLVALAVDYLLVGLLWLGIAETEPLLASAVDRWFGSGDAPAEGTPLLGRRSKSADGGASARAQSLSWHVHNALLLVLAFVTIWWNHWLSPTHGVCATSTSPSLSTTASSSTTASDFWRFWFYQVSSPRVLSGFPPLAWLSFAVLGLLYARVVIKARHLPPTTLAAGHFAASLAFAVLFVLTRVLRVGNLSEGCLRTPDQAARPDANPYLVSAASFFYVVKYPPDFAFFAYTLAAIFFLLGVLGMIPGRVATRRLGPLLAFGTSALFFYVVHMVVLFGLSILVTVRLFGHDNGMPPQMPGRPAVGVDNVVVWWANWAVVMGVMYPLCRWYSAFKKTRSADSVWRFF